MARTKPDGGRRTKLGIRDSDHKPLRDVIGTVVLDRYLVEAELGAGAMGTVYRGKHVKLKRPVAIKVLHQHLGHDQTMLARFHREALSAARLRHANVVAVLDVGETQGRQVMVLEFAEGNSLADLIGEPLPASRVIHLVRALLRGLDHAHSEGLIHRDLKPDNVIVSVGDDGSEVPRIVDFGIAVLVADDSQPRLTATGMIIGTPAYMAPEQAKGETIDQRADLFSLGVIVYEMLCGRLPFDGSATEVAVANISQDAPPIADRVPDIVVSEALEAFAHKLMARRLAERCASAHDALGLLDLVERDPAAALAALAVMDVAKAAAVIGLPVPPQKRRR